MFSKILIANRGEIAVRIIGTARRMGIRTVAIYSDADRDALHVELADEAVHVGPPTAAQSYLAAGRIVEACRATSADALHPGYGFLSEHAAFARSVEAAGITFIGPNAAAIETMGDKIQSKSLARAAGVTTVPGFLGVIETPEQAAEIAAGIGFPVMIKASAGGGGKGMRIARGPGEVTEGFLRAKSEAASFFGDDRVFLEKYIDDPRHIEIQVLADKHGNIVSLGERECSIQRRNQKIIEEAPSPLIDEATRQAMGAQAVALARAVGYDSAGTVEFIAAQDRSFFFLEMNTRLQVEHPVTELVTGIDLVEAMFRIAAGEALPFAQDQVRLHGWAVESRVYAEDPQRNFLPSTGRISRYAPPETGVSGDVTVRTDTGVRAGSEISVYYDPMIAKLITHAPTRQDAIEAQAQALDAFVIDGVRPNLPLLCAIMRHPRWRAGDLSTGFLAEEYPEGFAGLEPDEDERRILAAVALAMELAGNRRLDGLAGRLRPHSGAVRDQWAVMIGPARLDLHLTSAFSADPIAFDVSADGETISVRADWRPGERLWRGRVGSAAVTIQVEAIGSAFALSWRGIAVTARVFRPEIAALAALMPAKAAPDTSKQLRCPMPGLVVAIRVEEGQAVKAGETLAIVEAMKMENVLKATSDGAVAKILVRPGDSLAVDSVILEFA